MQAQIEDGTLVVRQMTAAERDGVSDAAPPTPAPAPARAAMGAREQVCTIDDLAGAAEAFLASTIREVQPISQVDSISLPIDGPVTARAASEFSARVQAELDGG